MERKKIKSGKKEISPEENLKKKRRKKKYNIANCKFQNTK